MSQYDFKFALGFNAFFEALLRQRVFVDLFIVKPAQFIVHLEGKGHNAIVQFMERLFRKPIDGMW
jgi:hypothetical protein